MEYLCPFFVSWDYNPNQLSLKPQPHPDFFWVFFDGLHPMRLTHSSLHLVPVPEAVRNAHLKSQPTEQQKQCVSSPQLAAVPGKMALSVTCSLLWECLTLFPTIKINSFWGCLWMMFRKWRWLCLTYLSYILCLRRAVGSGFSGNVFWLRVSPMVQECVKLHLGSISICLLKKVMETDE